jgi:hypothetical protein
MIAISIYHAYSPDYQYKKKDSQLMLIAQKMVESIKIAFHQHELEKASEIVFSEVLQFRLELFKRKNELNKFFLNFKNDIQEKKGKSKLARTLEIAKEITFVSFEEILKNDRLNVSIPLKDEYFSRFLNVSVFTEIYIIVGDLYLSNDINLHKKSKLDKLNDLLFNYSIEYAAFLSLINIIPIDKHYLPKSFEYVLSKKNILEKEISLSNTEMVAKVLNDGNLVFEFKVKTIELEHIKYTLNNFLVCILYEEEGYFVAENDILDIIGTGKTQNDAIKSLYEEFDFLFVRLNQLKSNQLSERLLRIKNTLNLLVNKY